MTEAADIWEERYRSRDAVWSGKPNDAVVELASTLTPGEALEIGCGEGADAIWLAEHGWRVTAVDVSRTALGRGAAEAARRGVDYAITWIEADLSDWTSERRYDLVTAAFLHSPSGLPREKVMRIGAESVVPGGAMLSVTHAERPPWSDAKAHFEGLPSAREGWDALALPAEDWELMVCGERERHGVGPDGNTHRLVDAVVLARRASGD